MKKNSLFSIIIFLYFVAVGLLLWLLKWVFFDYRPVAHNFDKWADKATGISTILGLLVIIPPSIVFIKNIHAYIYGSTHKRKISISVDDLQSLFQEAKTIGKTLKSIKIQSSINFVSDDTHSETNLTVHTPKSIGKDNKKEDKTIRLYISSPIRATLRFDKNEIIIPKSQIQYDNIYRFLLRLKSRLTQELGSKWLINFGEEYLQELAQNPKLTLDNMIQRSEEGRLLQIMDSDLIILIIPLSDWFINSYFEMLLAEGNGIPGLYFASNNSEYFSGDYGSGNKTVTGVVLSDKLTNNLINFNSLDEGEKNEYIDFYVTYIVKWYKYSLNGYKGYRKSGTKSLTTLQYLKLI